MVDGGIFPSTYPAHCPVGPTGLAASAWDFGAFYGFPPAPRSCWIYAWQVGSGGGAGHFPRRRLGRPRGFGGGLPRGAAHASSFLLSTLRTPSPLPPPWLSLSPLAAGWGPPAAWGSASRAWPASGWGPWHRCTWAGCPGLCGAVPGTTMGLGCLVVDVVWFWSCLPWWVGAS